MIDFDARYFAGHSSAHRRIQTKGGKKRLNVECAKVKYLKGSGGRRTEDFVKGQCGVIFLSRFNGFPDCIFISFTALAKQWRFPQEMSFMPLRVICGWGGGDGSTGPSTSIDLALTGGASNKDNMEAFKLKWRESDSRSLTDTERRSQTLITFSWSLW